MPSTGAALAALATLLHAAVAPSSGSPAGPRVAAPAATIAVDTQQLERVWDGIGGLSAGASSRLLYDYPEQARSDILDLLFAPNVGWGYQILKMELGGDCQSTWGTESSYLLR